MKVRGYKVVRVSWVDSTTIHKWQDPVGNECDLRDNIESVGFLIQKNKAHLTIAESVSVEGLVQCQTVIPMIAVRKVVYL